MRYVLALLLALLPLAVQAQPGRTENVILITLDGLRWQEVFGGADAGLVRDERYVRDTTELARRFWAASPEARRERLMPFLWGTVAREGQLYGNRWAGGRADVTNPHRFSYPGYNEILTGAADARINSNDKVPNPNVTVLEFVNEQPGFAGKVAAFGSWDVFPYIVNEARSGVPVNAGFEAAAGAGLSERERFLNELQGQVPSPWATVRLDAFTHHYAKEYLKRARPRLLYVAYGETDDFAHEGRYDAYLEAAQRTDSFVRDLWAWVESDEGYRGKTALVITTDHGRGAGDAWTGHGANVEGAEAIWVAVLGPDVPAAGMVTEGQVYQNQVAGTVAELLGLRFGEGSVIAGAVGR